MNRFDYIKGDISYEEYLKLNHIDRFRTSSFSDYCKRYVSHKYQEEYYRIISKNRTLKFLVDKSFENVEFFATIEKYMKYVNWTWGDNKQVPTIEELKETILELLIHSVGDDGCLMDECGCSTGGFEVKLKKNNLPLELKITFSEVDSKVVIAENITKINELRKDKLKFLYDAESSI